MASTTPPTDQRAGVRPISFVLNNGGSIGAPVTLTVRPEELTRNEPARATVHQTLGREVAGWVDDFGEGLGSVTIAGTTGWGGGGRPDGAEQFHKLNDLVAHDFPAAKQAAIDSGSDPAGVKLMFIDMLDDFAWNVKPMVFVLRRSKSRPLLFQYNISLQAISTAIDNPLVMMPQFGGLAAGLGSLGTAIRTLQGFVGSVQRMVSSAVAFVNGGLSPIAGTVKQFVGLSSSVFSVVSGTVGALKGGVTSVSNSMIGIASDLARVGANVFRTLSAIEGLPSSLKAELGRVASAYNEVHCIFKNSLRPGEVYENYEGLYGASNCSSTTGGNAASIYVGRNSFELMRSDQSAIATTSAALSGISGLSRFDPVLAPMAIPEMNRNLIAVVNGVTA